VVPVALASTVQAWHLAPDGAGDSRMTNACFVEGTVAAAPLTLKIHRGEGMALLAMNWRVGMPARRFRRLRDRI